MNQFWKDSMERVQSFLRGHGAECMDGMLVYRSPIHFLLGSAALGLAGCLIGLRFQWMAGALGLFLGMVLPAVVLYMSNESDNRMILMDLKWLYETISVQLQAGLHIHQALVESEGLMKNKRLKKALHTLTERLIRGEDMTSALNRFEESFRNRYISSFCVILRQMQDSGYGVKLLEDIRLQMEEMERMQLSRKKESLEMQLQFFQMLLFLGVLAMVMQGCIMAALRTMNYL